MRYARSDGGFWAFAGFSPLYLVTPANVVANLTADSNYTYWTITFQNGEKRIFNYTSGSLTAIIDRNGNTTQLSYDGVNRLVTVADPGGRHLYFNYPNNSSYLVSSVTSDVGITVSYTYDSRNRLAQVTEQDGTFLTFTYDANSNITAVKDSLGNIVEAHTYDSGHRGLTSSRGSSGAEAVTVSYPNP
jgi:YD repeat-containing protein